MPINDDAQWVSQTAGFQALAAGAQVVGSGPIDPNATIFFFDSGNSNGNVFYWFPPASSAAPAQAPAPAFSAISPNTIGSTIMMVYGSGRLGGQCIWTTGLEASEDPTETGYITGMWAFCEPADPTEPIRVQQMWANGTEFYNYGVNPTAALAVDNLTPDAQDALDACVASMVLHLGGPGEQPDATMSSILGAANVPAHRGLRTITLINFPALLSGNGVPQITARFVRTDTNLVLVSTAIQKCMDAYIIRNGIDVSFTTQGLEGIYCYGVTVSDQGTAVDLLVRHKEVYGYQILDGDPIRIVRKPINSELAIDLEVNETDIGRADGAPAISSTRINPAQMPIGITLAHPDPDFDYDTKTQPALHEGSATSSLISSFSTMFAVDGTTARQMAFDLLYRARAKALRLTFQLDNVETEVSDVIQVTTNEGDVYVTIAEETIYTKSRATGVRALALLTEAGNDIAGGYGLDGGKNLRRYWPEDCVWYQFIPTASRIWGNRAYEINYNSNPPKRRISALKYATEEVVEDAAGINGVDHGPMFEDNAYVYWVDYGQLIFYRCRKSASHVSRAFETITVNEFAGGWNSSVDLNHNCAFKDGKFYAVWNGQNGVGPTINHQYKLVVVDIDAWDGDAFESYDYWVFTNVLTADPGTAVQMGVSDSGMITIVTPMFNTPTLGRVFYTTVDDPSVWSSIDLTMKPDPGAAEGDWVYANDGTVVVSGSPYFGVGVPNRKHTVIALDCSGAVPVESYVNLQAQDSNIVNISQRHDSPFFTSPDHLFVMCNFTQRNNTDDAERYYLARLTHGALADAGGKFLDEIMYNGKESGPYGGRYCAADGRMYFHLLGLASDGDGRMLVVNEDLSSPVHYPTPVPPENDDFANATPLAVDIEQSGNLFWGSTEAGEPKPSWAIQPPTTFAATAQEFAWLYNNGHSVWFKFFVSEAGAFKIDVADQFGGKAHSVQVYTGADVASLTEINSQVSLGHSFPPTPYTPTTLYFAGAANTMHYISIRHDATGGFRGFPYIGVSQPDVDKQGQYTIVISGIEPDDDEDSLLLNLF